MRIFNGTNYHLDLPLTGLQRIQIAPHSVSKDFMPNNEFLSLLVGSYDYSELALIVSGPYEINMCSSVSGSVGFVVQTLEEAIERFTPKTAAPVIEEVVEEVTDDVKPREGWEEKFEEYAKEGEDELVIPAEVDAEALSSADELDQKDETVELTKKEEKKAKKSRPKRRWNQEDENTEKEG